ncbi:MAG: hypothetical protein KAS32_19520 [Candidatus Peribacteraceae bacterium]|nr:hypothetical protein [Candidatus Peribacteraceae bacterium]
MRKRFWITEKGYISRREIILNVRLSFETFNKQMKKISVSVSDFQESIQRMGLIDKIAVNLQTKKK